MTIRFQDNLQATKLQGSSELCCYASDAPALLILLVFALRQ